MADTFVKIQDIIEQWGFSASTDPNGPESAVMTLLRKIKAPSIRRHPSGKRGVMGLTVKQFEKANILLEGFQRGGSGQARETGPAQGGNSRRV